MSLKTNLIKTAAGVAAAGALVGGIGAFQPESKRDTIHVGCFDRGAKLVVTDDRGNSIPAGDEVVDLGKKRNVSCLSEDGTYGRISMIQRTSVVDSGREISNVYQEICFTDQPQLALKCATSPDAGFLARTGSSFPQNKDGDKAFLVCVGGKATGSCVKKP